MSMPIDQAQRDLAIDPTQSFIVQAPAGSGKTELLVQRYLTLLAHACHQPEEIIAITFTRKAATEMRNRILMALETAAKNPEVISKTALLATAALQKNNEQAWKILENPNRLRITTIDAFCKTITEKMPLLAKFGMSPNINNDSRPLYQQAARRLLNSLEESEPWSKALETLLLHFDNKMEQVENLFITMLAKREQWLPHIIKAKNSSHQLREILESGLQHIIEDVLSQAINAIPKELSNEIVSLSAFAAQNLMGNKKISLVTSCQDLNKIPLADISELGQWRGIAALFLTGKFQWRKRVNANDGFPPEDEHKPHKARMESLLENLHNQEALRQIFQEILELPAPTYNESQWQAIEALVELLPILAAQLNVIFQEVGAVDFSQVAQAALSALGKLDSPSELALKLDYQIRHLLVDEFQDTALLQFKLLELITAGWQANDGRTLFLVGDPMQSIYRFRQAEVGLFIRAQISGINQILLKPIRLQVNFRSNATLINWFNQSFSQIFPTTNNISKGAVTFSPSTAQTQEETETTVQLHPFIDADEIVQAEKIASIIQSIQANDPKKSIAILVRARSHLSKVLSALNAAKISYQGVEIQKLSQATIVQDLKMLTFAILHPADRLAWFSCLRAPWCGLLLSDLHIIASHSKNSIIWNAITSQSVQQLLCENGQQRINKFVSIMEPILLQRERELLRDTVQFAWQNLAGNLGVFKEDDAIGVEAYFKILDQFDWNDLIGNRQLLEDQLEQKYAQPPLIENSNVKIMTIHHAKGLEFDVVILPYLERSKKNLENELLLWHEQPRMDADSDLVFAPMKSSFADGDSIYNYLKKQETERIANEDTRLLYVAATRAKQKLHLLANVKTEINAGEKQVKHPRQSFLSLLWPIVSDNFTSELDISVDKIIQLEPSNFHRKLCRIKLNALLEFLPKNNSHPYSTALLIPKKPLFRLENNLSRNIGKLIHYIFYQMTQFDLDKINLLTLKNHYQSRLHEFGILQEETSYALNLAEVAINNILSDPRGRWILTQHEDARSEHSLASVQDSSFQSYIIDRTFIVNGKRWIIDFKTSVCEENKYAEFIDEQKNIYAEQLNTYATIYHNIENRPIFLGLYFPLMAQFCEWKYEPPTQISNSKKSDIKV